ncbi:MAG: hypothetical protein J6V44_15050 [Methanobrevibacter sp.]|nr:hypothetical protein [Methanobrevibacter sp.]MBO7696547.1 hypothetical protein [Methanobrevibacter sp.]
MKLSAYVYKFNNKVQRKYIVDKDQMIKLFKDCKDRFVTFGNMGGFIDGPDFAKVCAIAKSFDVKEDGITADIDVLDTPNGRLLKELLKVMNDSMLISCVYIGDIHNKQIFPQTIPYLVIGENQFGYRLKMEEG